MRAEPKDPRRCRVPEESAINAIFGEVFIDANVVLLELLKLEELKLPLSKTGVPHGMLSVLGVAQPLLPARSCGPKVSSAVAATLVVVAPLGGYLAISWTSGEFGCTC